MTAIPTKQVDERPILFSDPMVRALLAGTKTQTRRVIKPEWMRCLDPEDDEDLAKILAQCPYGKPGAQLWVRECFTTDHAQFYPNFPVIYRADGYDPLKDQGPDDDHPGEVYSPEQKSWYRFRWSPSIFCSRPYSRITLEILSIGVERVQEITEADAIAEGFSGVPEFRALWEKLNGSRGFGWDENPWVWPITFKRIKP